MKLIKILPVLVTLVASIMPAAADVLKLNSSVDGVESSSVIGANDLQRIYRALDETGEPVVYLHYQDEVGSYYWWRYRDLKSIEILKPEAVKFAIDFPPILPIWNSANNSAIDYSLDFHGRVYLDETADAGIVRSGTITIPEEFGSAPASANIIKDYQGRLNYQLGGEHGTEATFTVTASTKNLAHSPYFQEFSNTSGSFVDKINLYLYKYSYTSWPYGSEDCSENKYDRYNRQFVCSTGDGETECERTLHCELNPYFVNHGGTVKIEVFNGRLNNGAQLSESETADYVYLPDNTIEVNKSNVDLSSPKITVPIRFNARKFKPGDVFRFSVFPVLSANPDAPEWLTKLLSYLSGYSFTMYCTERDERPNRLNVSKATFPDLEPTESSVEALFDDDPATFCHSAWTFSNKRTAPYGSYIDVEFDEPVENIGFAMQTRSYSTSGGHPVQMALYYSNDGETWQHLASPAVQGEYTIANWITEFADESNWFKAPEKFKYLRWCVIRNSKGTSLLEQEASDNESKAYWNLAELHFYGK